MVPSSEAVLRAYERLAPRLGLSPRASATAIRVALREADHLADDIYDVPAAMLFAFGRYPRCFAGFRTMSVLVVAWYASSLGFKLDASPSELEKMLVSVARSESTFDEVRAWMGEKLLPFGG